MTTPLPLTPLPREAFAVTMRIGVVAASSGTTVDVTIADGDPPLTAVPVLASVATLTVGARVLVLMDRETAVVIGNPK